MDEVVDIVEDMNVFSKEDLDQALEKSEEDIKAKRLVSFSDFKEKLKNKYNI
nr:hypothetical protein [uncultured Flavobacterium sp.]